MPPTIQATWPEQYQAELLMRIAGRKMVERQVGNTATLLCAEPWLRG